MRGRDEHDGEEYASGAIAPGEFSALLQELARAPPPSEEPADELGPGAVVGRFELIRELGRGGFGVVWEARDRELGRAVAIKLVRGRGAARSDERVLREADAAAQLSHPNIVTLFDVGRSEQGPYLVFELLHGETLHERLARGDLSVRDAFRVATEIARGVACAHGRGVVHRDLKPANVLVCDDGRIKVLDFGLAHAFGRRSERGGTPEYMAPEQWRDAPEDERSDVFALGVILYRMLTGTYPFTARDMRRAGGPPAPAPAVDVPGCPGAGALIATMLAVDPVKRPRDAAEVLNALAPLAAAVERAPSRATLQPLRARRIRYRAAGRHAWRWVAAAVVAAAVLFAGSRWALGPLRSSHSPAAASGALEPRGTRSLEAYQHHLRALDLRLRECDTVAAEQEARRALAIDPEFGMAHMQLGLLLLYNGEKLADSNAHWRAARSLADRMPDKERQLILLDQYITTSMLPPGDEREHKAFSLRAYDQLAARYPDDAYVLFAAGFAHAFYEDDEGSLTYYARSLEVDPGQCYVLGMLSRTLVRLGRVPEGIPIARRAVTARPNTPNLAILARLLMLNGQREEAIGTAREALRVRRNASVGVRAACVLATLGEPRDAEDAAAPVREATSPVSRTWLQLRALSMGLQGRARDALSAWPGDDPRYVFHLDTRAALLGIGHPRLAAPATVQRLREVRAPALVAGELVFHGDAEAGKIAATGLDRGSPAYAYYAAAMLAHERRWEEALPALRALLLPVGGGPIGQPDARLNDQWQVRVLLGEGLLELGRPAEALEVATSLDTYDDCSVGGAENSPRIWIIRARALQRLGHASEADAVLERFERQWRDADPGLPLLHEARAIRRELALAGR